MTEQPPLLADAPESTPVTCLGLTFETGAAGLAFVEAGLGIENRVAT